MEELSKLPFSDLLAMYQYVSTLPLSKNEETKKIIKARTAELEKELFNRAFGLNPYTQQKKVAVSE